jgi:general secretion pathway protein D
MKSLASVRFLLGFVLLASMLSPAAVLAIGDGKKHFRAGMKHEVAEAWDKAAEEFALAVTENPKNPEYRLHLQRALFNASQMYMKKGAMAAAEKDYEGAYIAFRKAYAFDPVNELAKSEMERMIRLQNQVQGGGNPDANADPKVKLVPTGYSGGTKPQDVQIPQRLAKLRDLPFPGGVDLQFVVRELARDLDLNVIFDAESRLDNRRVKIELKGVTSARALDYIFLQENLFFQKVGPRTILVATGNRRTNFQQLVLRTFYLANASPKDVKAVITSAIPAQPGRSQTIVLEDAATNSITVRDTEENIRLIGKLISSLDKDRAEVVMDVAIYEVNKNDLLQFGNQLGTTAQLGNIGGVGFPIAHAGNTGPITSAFPFTTTGLASIALGLPISSIAALQKKDNTKLLASTQIHAFNNEDSSARIGQRVPVQSAQFVGVGSTTPGSNGVVSNVINYEQVGLTLKFKPIVFPNQDVQVAMDIESKDVVGASTLTPTFTERKITGTARVQNNKTLLLASVAQNTETNGRQGLPLLGLIPIIGRLFTAPTRDNRQVDIVIAITPRVIRAPAILPEDEVERPTGSLATPTSGSLEAMIIDEEREEMLAAARRLPTMAQVQLPDQSPDAPAYVRGAAPAAQPVKDAPAAVTPSNGVVTAAIRPIDSGVKTLDIDRTADSAPTDAPALVPISSGLQPASASARVEFAQTLAEMKKGDRARVAVMIKASGPFRSAVLGLRSDETKVAIRGVYFGDVFGVQATNTPAAPLMNQNGKMLVSLTAPESADAAGTLAFIEIEALADGRPEIAFDRDVINLLAIDGKNFRIEF